MSQAQLWEQAVAHSVILSVCCECGEVYDGGVVDPKSAGLSHGYDEPCYLRAKAQIAAALAAEK